MYAHLSLSVALSSSCSQCIFFSLSRVSLSVCISKYIRPSFPRGIPSTAVVVLVLVLVFVLRRLRLRCRRSMRFSLFIPRSSHILFHTHTHRETRKKSRLAPRGYRLGRQYDVSSLVTIRRRQTDNHGEKKRNIYWHSALFFLFSNSREIFYDRISFQQKKRGENERGEGRWESS